MAETVQQRLGNREITHPGDGIDVDRGASHDTLDHSKSRPRTDRNVLPNQVEFVPSRPAGHVDVGAKAQRIDAGAYRVLDRRYRRKVHDRDHLVRDVGEAEANGMQHPRRTSQLVSAKCGKEPLDRRAARSCAQITTSGLASIRNDGEHAACVVVSGSQPSKALVAHQHEIALLGLVPGCGRVETRRTVLDGKVTVGRERLAHGQRCAIERLRAEPLHRIAIDGMDRRERAGHGFC